MADHEPVDGRDVGDQVQGAGEAERLVILMPVRGIDARRPRAGVRGHPVRR